MSWYCPVTLFLLPWGLRVNIANGNLIPTKEDLVRVARATDNICVVRLLFTKMKTHESFLKLKPLSLYITHDLNFIFILVSIQLCSSTVIIINEGFNVIETLMLSACCEITGIVKHFSSYLTTLTRSILARIKFLLVTLSCRTVNRG